MKSLFKLFLLTFLIPGLNISGLLAQQDCSPAQADAILNANNITATFNGGGSLWFDGQNAGYEWNDPNGSTDAPGPLIFAGGLWMGGFDNGGNIHMTAQTYATDDQVGYWPGPIVTDADANHCANWDKYFVVNRSDLDLFKSDFQDNGQIDDPIPPSILGWPAIGNTAFNGVHGFDLPDQELAPFYDENGDGIYDAAAGDYPDTRKADQVIWWVFNDVGGVNNIGASTTNSELQAMVYAYNSSISAIDNTTFYDIKHIYRGTEILDSFYYGLWMDPDLGCAVDDYVGCFPEEDMFFVYNQDASDGIDDCNCEFGQQSFCEDIPVLGCKLIRGPLNEWGEEIDMTGFNVYQNGSINPWGLPGSDPNTLVEYYRILTGSRADGAPLVTPDFGSTTYAFTGNPADTTAWSMCTQPLPPADNRLVMSMGNFRLDPGATNHIVFALVVEPSVAHPCPDLTGLIQSANEVKNFYYSPFTTSVQENQLTTNDLRLYPNPITDQSVIELVGKNNQQLETVELYRMDGKLIKRYNAINDRQLSINREGLVPGLLIYKVQLTNGEWGSGKMLVR